MTDIVPSQEPQTPAVPVQAGLDPKNSRTRAQTRRTKVLEETEEHEVLPTGDDVSIHEVRQVNEVVKRVAVVCKSKKQQQTEGQVGEREEQQGGDADADIVEVATDATLEAELREALNRGERWVQQQPSRSGRGGCTNIMRSVEEEVINEGQDRTVGMGEGIAVEERPGEQSRATITRKRGRRPEGEASRAQRGRTGSMIRQPLPAGAEVAIASEEPAVPEEWVRVVQEEIADQPQGVSQEEGLFQTPMAASPIETGDGGVEEERGKKRRGPQPLRTQEGPKTPGKRLREAITGATEALRRIVPLPATIPGSGGEEGPSVRPAQGPTQPPNRSNTIEKELAKKRVAQGSLRGAKKKKGRRHRAHREESFKRYLLRVLKQIHPELAISSRAMAIMNAFVVDQFERIVEEAARLTTLGKRVTLTAREMQTAVKLVLAGGELSDHAMTSFSDLHASRILDACALDGLGLGMQSPLDHPPSDPAAFFIGDIDATDAQQSGLDNACQPITTLSISGLDDMRVLPRIPSGDADLLLDASTPAAFSATHWPAFPAIPEHAELLMQPTEYRSLDPSGGASGLSEIKLYGPDGSPNSSMEPDGLNISACTSPSGSPTSSMGGEHRNVPRVASMPNLQSYMPGIGKMVPSGPSEMDLRRKALTRSAGMPRSRSANDVTDLTRYAIPHSEFLTPPHLRKGKGGRQPAADPRLDPRIDPKKARRILANRLSAAKSKLKQKSATDGIRQRLEMLRMQREGLVSEAFKYEEAYMAQESEREALRAQLRAAEEALKTNDSGEAPSPLGLVA